MTFAFYGANQKQEIKSFENAQEISVNVDWGWHNIDWDCVRKGFEAGERAAGLGFSGEEQAIIANYAYRVCLDDKN